SFHCRRRPRAPHRRRIEDLPRSRRRPRAPRHRSRARKGGELRQLRSSQRRRCHPGGAPWRQKAGEVLLRCGEYGARDFRQQGGSGRASRGQPKERIRRWRRLDLGEAARLSCQTPRQAPPAFAVGRPRTRARERERERESKGTSEGLH
uniref:Uncharacterized protein n=1 Tax=Oryza glumipatula TaxID=40148 RepID=A0A0D9YAT5_9ORYZ